MKAAGIICEYNPFHLGHARQMNLIRRELGDDTPIVCVMSGNYVQRGAPAMWDKFTRAEAAAACGADLVLELPLTCVLQSAEGFAAGGVEILTKSGVASHISFGAECGDGQMLMELAVKSLSEVCEADLRRYLAEGLSYAAARQAALHDTEGVLLKPNNILGLEYCRALLRQQSPLQPLVVQRTGDYHSTDAAEFPSATAVRSRFPDENWQELMPEQAAAVFHGRPWYETSFGARAVLARLRALSDEEWAQTAHGSEGLWSKAMKAAAVCGTLEEIIAQTKSKRYPQTRIQRLLLCAYLGLTDTELHQPIPYTRVLAANETGRKLLRQIRDIGALEVLNPGQKPKQAEYYRLETRASDLYTLFSADGFPSPAGQEQRARIKF